MYNFTYMVGCLIWVFIWLGLYYKFPDDRKVMVIIGMGIGLSGIILEQFIWTDDWWQPITITGTKVGIEDFLLGFGIGGSSINISKLVLKEPKRTYPNNIIANIRKEVILLIIVSIILGNTAYFLLHIHSVIASYIAMLIPAIIVFFRLPKLTFQSFFTGIILVMISICDFNLMLILDSEFVKHWWFFHNLTGIIFLGVPLEDLLWFFSVGIFIKSLYSYWKLG